MAPSYGLFQASLLESSSNQDPVQLTELAGDLPSLDSLAINLFPPTYAPDDLVLRFRKMFQSLRPLKFLTIKGTRSKALLNDILSYHGSTLKGFIIKPFFKDSRVKQEGSISTRYST